MYSLGVLSAVILLILFLRAFMAAESRTLFSPGFDSDKVGDGRLGPTQGG